MASAKSVNYDLVGSDYSMSSGKGSTGIFSKPSSSGNFFTNGGLIGAIGRSTSSASVKRVTDAISGASSPLADPADSLAQYLNGSTSGGSSGGSSGYYGSSSSASYHAPATPQVLSYVDAPYAEQYGMDAITAYQEALSNSAVRRHVNDLKLAGLNPVLGYSGSANGVYSAAPLVVDSGSGVVSGSSGYGSSGSGRTTSTLASIGSQLIRNLPGIVGGVVAIGTKGNVGKSYGAQQVAQAVSNIFRYS